MTYEKFQNQIQRAENIGLKMLTSKEVEKLYKKVKKEQGSLDYAENKHFPFGYIFDFYSDKKNFSFCVMNEKIKNNLVDFINK